MVDDTIFSPGSFNTQEVMNRGWGTVQYGRDSDAIVEFYNRSVLNKAKSEETGKPHYETKVYVKVTQPGEQRFNIVDRPVQRSDTQRWPAQWQNFQRNRQQIPDGTPVDHLYPGDPALGDMFKANGIFTIEQLANLSSAGIDSLQMGGQKHVNFAQDYLKVASKGVAATQYRSDLEKRDREISSLKRQLQEQAEIISQLRTNGANNMDMAQIQALIAGAMARPQHMPNQGFDAQSTMIAANHPAQAVPKPRRKRTSLA